MFSLKWLNYRMDCDEIWFRPEGNFHVTLRMTCNNFGDPLTFHLTPSSGQKLYLSKLKANDIPISLSCTLCLVLVSKW